MFQFIAWCREAKIEPFVIFNMGTGTLEEALRWIEYCNGTGDTCVLLLVSILRPLLTPKE
jgi:alpha-L-arabinofuranosidase